MTKYSIIAFQPELMTFLDKLQELGVMDITRKSTAFDDMSRAKIEFSKNEKETIKKLKYFIEKNKDVEAPKLTISDGVNLTDMVNQLFTDLTASQTKLASLIREKEEAFPWGEFEPSDVERIHNIGLHAHFYQVSEKRYNPEWESQYPIQILNRQNGHYYFAVISQADEPFSFPVAESKFPDQPASEILKGIELLSAKISSVTRQLIGMKDYIPEMEKKYNHDTQELDKYFAYSSSASEAENTLSLLEGFAPSDNDAEVKQFLDDTDDIVYISEAAKSEDNPPIKLKNNWFSKLFEPIGNLYILPTYDELDLTPYFAPFYMLFFGLCLGDMGYGIVLLIAGLIMTLKVPSMKEYGKLVIVLGIGTMIMPILNGTFFGTKIYDVFNMPDNIKGMFFNDIQMFWFAIIFGVFQIVVARLISAVYQMKRKGWQHGMSNIGWCLILIWISLLYAGSQSGKELAPAWMGYAFGCGGLILVLFFSKTEGNIFKRFLGGIASLYDITGFFGDILSYIRLFGLGAAGGCLGMVINAMSLALKGIPYAGWFLCIFLLIVGHIFVMLLSALGAFVHPMRLTFVEFYKNAGFTGGGKEYRPLKK
ncbi:MAG: V-type ATPase 116kDa subunit family protein [Bacteroidales bacterium]|nr:V-type ATPase 116kDa subunit family protein [Bacteroidales bacterium]MDD4670150.1 V-type ATPase 116kDa subunit family protein [Bacteroidales bacterium]